MATDVALVAARRRRRRRLLVGGPVALLAVLGLWAAARPGIAIAPHPSASLPARPGPAEAGQLVSLPELRARAARAAAGSEPEASAVADLLAWARRAVDERPSPREPLRIKGTTGPFVDDTATAYGLALAWGVSGEERFARTALEFVLAWVRTTRTLEDACPDGGECQTSLIVSRVAPGFVFAMDLLADSGVVTTADDGSFRTWLAGVILPVASLRTNNWGDAGTFLRASATRYLGDEAGWQAAIQAWRSLLDLIPPDGHIPEEVRRGSSGLSYTQEALLYKLAVARIAERDGSDLWGSSGAAGGTFRGAVELAARYQTDPKGWPWAKRANNPSVGPGWELAYAQWQDPLAADLIRGARPLGEDGHSAIRWTTLTNGIMLGD